MKNKTTDILFGIIFLLVMIGSVSANFDWSMYGNSYQPITQAQLTSAISLFNSTNVSILALGSGQTQFTHPTQALVGTMLGSDTNYLFYQDGNYLKVYTNGLTFFTEYYSTYTPLGQMSMVDWDSDGLKEVAGFFEENSTNIHFQVLKLNSTSNLLNVIYDYNFDNFVNDTAGVRCSGNECYSILFESNGTGYHWYDFWINSTGYVTHLLFTDRENYTALEPPSKVDFNNDGIDDYLVFSEEKVVVYNQLGSIMRGWNFSRGAGRDEFVTGAKLFLPYGSAYWKVAVVYDVPFQAWSSLECGGSDFACGKIQLLNIIDGAIILEQAFIGTVTSADNPRVLGLAIADYDNDNYDDIWVVGSRLTSNRLASLTIYEGDGTVLYSNNSLGASLGAVYPSSQITLGKMDNNNIYDVLIYDGSLNIWSPSANAYIYQDSSVTGQGSCVPVDLTYDGLLDIVCSSSADTNIYYPDYINQNSVIDVVTYSPSTIIEKQSYLSIIINASDYEGDNILYTHKCSGLGNWSADDSSSIKSCYYGFVGSYNMTVGVRDSYHAGYNYFSQEISVVETGTICGNGICDSGETNINCPADCPIANQTQSSSGTGGIPIPTQIVSTTDYNQGLLPEVYFGTLGFLSNTLQPMMVLIFLIFFVFIILAIAFIIRRIGHKVSELSH